MKAKLSKIASIFIPLLLGFGLIYYQYTTLSVEELNKIKSCFQQADYFYIFLSLFIVIALSIYGYILIKHRWFLNKGTIKYCNEKMIFAYNNSPNEINYSDIFRIEKEQSFISGTSFFIYTKEDRKAKIKFNFYDDIDTMDFEDKLKNKNISIHNL